MRLAVFTVLGLASLAVAAEPEHPAPAVDSFAAAMALKRERRYPEARAALEAFVAANPNHAAACHELGLIWRLRNDTEAFHSAVKWLGRAVELEPGNPRYLGDYGGTSLQLASRTRTASAAIRGRNAMEKAVALAPDYLDAREGLYEFYRQAPWPLGSREKAAAQLEEIRRRDSQRAMLLDVNACVREKNYDEAFRLCEAVLARKPADYTALYSLGRTAALSGQNLERGLEALRQCLELDPPSPAAPTHRNVWNRIGDSLEKLGRHEEAKAAYEAARQPDVP